MKKVFADSHYWIAIANPRDPWAGAAKAAKARMGRVQIVTTDEVLNEFLTGMSKGGSALRQGAVRMVRAILQNANVQVVAQSRESFLRALERYEARADKKYSLTDCSSMNVLDDESISDVLTNDHHFEQEGYTVLVKRENPVK